MPTPNINAEKIQGNLTGVTIVSSSTINTSTVNTNRLTATTIVVRSTGSTNASTAMTIFNSSGFLSFIVLDNGNIYSNGGGTGNTSNNAFGLNAMVTTTTGVQNNGFGRSLQAITAGNNNNGFGYLSLGNLTTGSSNIGIGTGALRFNQASSNSIAIGTDALSAASGGTNVGIGTNGLADLTTGTNSTAVGYNTGRGVTTGINNTILGANVTGLPVGLTSTIIIAEGSGTANRRIFIDNVANIGFGSGALGAYTLGTGGNNIAIGTSALSLLTSSSDQLAIGINALKNLTTGANNTAVGNRALENSNGANNVAIGRNAMLNSFTGSSNTAVGVNALLNSSGDSCVAIGASALQNSTGSTNTAVGNNSLFVLTTGIGNTAVGYGLNGGGITVGNYNTLLGANIGGLASGLTQNIIIADGLGNQRIVSDNIGNVSVYGLSAITSFTATTGFVKVGYGSLISQQAVGDFLTSQFIANGGLFLSSRQTQGIGFHINGIEKARITGAGLFGIGTNAPRELLEVSGNTIVSGFTATTNVTLNSIGSKLIIATGTNASVGTVALIAGTATVSNTLVTNSSIIQLTPQNLGTVTAPKAIGITARSVGTSFTITSADLTDTSTIGWQIIEQK